jgi:hypothetical protein
MTVNSYLMQALYTYTVTATATAIVLRKTVTHALYSGLRNAAQAI